MDASTIILIITNVATLIFGGGIAWGKIKALEKRMEKQENMSDRLTRIETKVDIILSNKN